MPGTPEDFAASAAPHERASAAPDAMPEIGDVIAGKYEIERVLGVGGMGLVVAARHLHIGQRVAIKFLHREVSRDPQAIARFLREARAAVALSSQHAAKVLDVGTLDAGLPYMVMEYLEGLDLEQTLQRGGPMRVADATNLVIQASEAIAEAHALGIVHRDLKPANVFLARAVDGAPLVKVLDFGVSKTASGQGPDPTQHLTKAGALMGSPGYMSPEQVRNAKDVDARSDVWALAVTLYELLTGVHPFAADSLGATFSKILAEPIERIESVRPDVPEGLARAIERCFERDRERRTPSVAVFATDLLPFAPPEAARIVARIRAIAGLDSAPTRTLAPEAAAQATLPLGRSVVTATTTHWHSTPATPPSAAPPRSATAKVAVVLGVGALVGAVLVVAAWSVASRGHEAEVTAAAASGALRASTPVEAALPSLPPETAAAAAEPASAAPPAVVASAMAAPPLDRPLHAVPAARPFPTARPRAAPSSTPAHHETDLY
jgi:hypothetical protein